MPGVLAFTAWQLLLAGVPRAAAVTYSIATSGDAVAEGNATERISADGLVEEKVFDADGMELQRFLRLLQQDSLHSLAVAAKPLSSHAQLTAYRAGLLEERADIHRGIVESTELMTIMNNLMSYNVHMLKIGDHIRHHLEAKNGIALPSGTPATDKVVKDLDNIMALDVTKNEELDNAFVMQKRWKVTYDNDQTEDVKMTRTLQGLGGDE
jgi:hypothetical protein